MDIISLMKSKVLRSLPFISGVLLATLTFSPARADESEFDAKPVPVKTPPPVYPSQLRRDGVAGLVAVRVTIDEQGNVSECSVSKSTNPEFESAALSAIRNWKFKPAVKGGAAVKSHLIIPLKFAVDE